MCIRDRYGIFACGEIMRTTSGRILSGNRECPKEANAKALDILNKGVDSLSFHVKAKELNAEYIETLLNDCLLYTSNRAVGTGS